MESLTGNPLEVLKQITDAKQVESPLLSVLSNLEDNKLTKEKVQMVVSLALEELIHRAREDFYTFVRLMANFVLEIPYKDGKHIHLICKELQDLYEGRNLRLMVFLPPRSMKSKLCSVLFPAWCMGRSPNWQVIQVGHSTKFAEDNFSAKVRDLVKTEEFLKIFPELKISKSTSGKGQWETTSRGKYVAAGAGKSIAGVGADVSICDDVLSEQTAISDIERTKINDWYYPGLNSRLQPGGRELVINTRWHMDDLSGHLLQMEENQKKMIETGEMDNNDEEYHAPWRVISIPAIMDEESSELMGIPVGESYWPEHWTKKNLMVRKSRMTPQAWAALYMQNPIPDEGNIIKPEWCQKWEKRDDPPLEYVLLSLDTAFSEKQTADYSAITVWGVFFTREVDLTGVEYTLPHLMMLDAYRGRWGLYELCGMVTDLMKQYSPDSVIVEEKGSGISLIRELGRRGIPVLPYNPGTTDKATRLHTCTPTFYNKQVWFKDTSLTSDVIAELLAFPAGKHDDFVDTTSQAVIFMREASKIWLTEDGDAWPDEEKENTYKPPRKTYWSAASS